MLEEQLDEVEKMSKVIRVLDSFSFLDHKMQIMTAQVLLMVADAEINNKEVQLRDISKKFDVPSGTASRNIHYWAEGHTERKGGMGLLSINTDPTDPRKIQIRLTGKGRMFVHQLYEYL